MTVPLNFCTRCGSSYSQPGTCNCFAPTPPVVVAPQPAPYIPYIPQPVSPFPQYPLGTWITYTACDTAGTTYTQNMYTLTPAERVDIRVDPAGNVAMTAKTVTDAVARMSQASASLVA